jgi:L-aminopeptidase/D-esterase-like protein
VPPCRSQSRKPRGISATPPRNLPPCEEKERLRVLYNAAAECYAAAVNEVSLSRGKTTQEEYNHSRALLDEARNVRDSARLALEQHKEEHGC